MAKFWSVDNWRESSDNLLDDTVNWIAVNNDWKRCIDVFLKIEKDQIKNLDHR